MRFSEIFLAIGFILLLLGAAGAESASVALPLGMIALGGLFIIVGAFFNSFDVRIERR